MTAQLIDGKAVAAQLKNTLKEKIAAQTKKLKRPPGLAVILVGNDPASAIYVKNKQEACRLVGIQSTYHPLDQDITQTALAKLIQTLNVDPTVDGILLQLPLPKHIHAEEVLDQINPHKDVDGFHAYNLGCLAQRRPALRPCTPLGVMMLLDHIKQVYKGKHAVVVGASNIVGRPMALELLIAGATVTVCHRFTDNLKYFVEQADILIAAVGKPGLIPGEWVKPGATVIDIGLTRLANGTLAGDVGFEAALARAGFITPVPGGVGPMTVAALMQNTYEASMRETV